MTVSDSSIATHICPKCREAKPLTREFWTPEKEQRSNQWQLYACRLCINICRKPRTDEQRKRDAESARLRRSTEHGRAKNNQQVREWKRNNPEKRIEERRRAREKQGKPYFPGVPPHVAANIVRYGAEGSPGQIAERMAERKAKAEALKTEREAIKKRKESMTDEEMKQHYEALGKPWLNPRLTDSEKYRLQYKLDPEYAIHERMRRQLKKAATNDGVADMIRAALKSGGESPKTTELLGYTITELRQHLERQFTKRMSWEKFMQGDIHIDHIIPKASFDLTDPDQWKICWSLPNLRPLMAKDNLSKSAKVETLL